MALPLIPFAIKGIIIALKYAAGKVAVTKTVAVGLKAATAQFGAAATTAAVIGGCAIVGGVAWTVENIQRAQSAYEKARNRDYAGAAQSLAAIATSIKIMSASDLGQDLLNWHEMGQPLSQVPDLALKAKSYADEAQASYKST